jgi:NIMA (never in mitosis gene a)-related kinase 1/4/5
MKNVNVIAYQQSFFDGNHLYIVMEYYENGELHREINARTATGTYYTEDEVMETFVQVLLGLAHIHNCRILHRDLKTQNIFVGRGGVCKV